MSSVPEPQYDHLTRAAVAQLAEDFYEKRVSYSDFVDGVHEHPDPDVAALYDAVEHSYDDDARALIRKLRGAS